MERINRKLFQFVQKNFQTRKCSIYKSMHSLTKSCNSILRFWLSFCCNKYSVWLYLSQYIFEKLGRNLPAGVSITTDARKQGNWSTWKVIILVSSPTDIVEEMHHPISHHRILECLLLCELLFKCIDNVNSIIDKWQLWLKLDLHLTTEVVWSNLPGRGLHKYSWIGSRRFNNGSHVAISVILS